MQRAIANSALTLWFLIQTDEAQQTDSKRSLSADLSPKKKKVKTFDINLESAPSDGLYSSFSVLINNMSFGASNVNLYAFIQKITEKVERCDMSQILFVGGLCKYQ